MSHDYGAGRYVCDGPTCTRSIRPKAAGSKKWRRLEISNLDQSNGSIMHYCPACVKELQAEIAEATA